MDFDVNVREGILTPVSEVFAAVVDPEQMCNYFISRASGPLKAGTTVTWEFNDVGAKVSLDVLEVEENRQIVWESSALGPRIRTSIQFAPDGPNATVVVITEGKFSLTEGGVKRALGQNAGWTYTLCGLKAYVQYGINLRTGLNRRLTDVSGEGTCAGAPPIIVEQTYRASRNQVWEAITNKNLMRQWFFENIGDFVLRVGFYTSFNVASGGKNYLHVWRVVEVVPKARLVLEWQYGGYPGDSFVTLDLADSGDGTRLRLTHRGLDTFPADDPALSRESCINGWNYFVKERLRTFLEANTN